MGGCEAKRNAAAAAPCGTRTRNAAATRQAILDAAKTCFMQEGYDQAGVREIAGRAGVDPALVNRYFGSKERLFAEAVAAKFQLSDLFAGERETLGERLVHVVLTKKATTGDYNPLVALLRSSSSEVGGAMLREAIVNGFVRRLAEHLDGDDAESRAEVVGAMLLGLLVLRTVGGPSFADGDDRFAAVVSRTLQELIDGTV
jgi:AcrR family transcriptional regulator